MAVNNNNNNNNNTNKKKKSKAQRKSTLIRVAAIAMSVLMVGGLIASFVASL